MSKKGCYILKCVSSYPCSRINSNTKSSFWLSQQQSVSKNYKPYKITMWSLIAVSWLFLFTVNPIDTSWEVLNRTSKTEMENCYLIQKKVQVKRRNTRSMKVWTECSHMKEDWSINKHNRLQKLEMWMDMCTMELQIL